MVDQATVDSLLRAAESETKRWGGSEPSLVHVAYVASRKWTEEFKAEFGDDGASGIVSLLEHQRFSGTVADARLLLDEAASPADFMKSLHARLAPDLRGDTSAGSATTGAPASTSEQDGEKDGEKAGRPEGERGGESPWPPRSADLVEPVEPRADVVGRDQVVDELLAQLSRPTPVVAALVGRRGSGRTTVLAALAARLQEAPAARTVWRVPGHAGLEPHHLAWLTKDAPEGAVVVLDDFDAAARVATSFPSREVLHAASRLDGEPGPRFLLVLDERHVAKLDVLHAPLAESLVHVGLDELPHELVGEVVAAEVAKVATQVGVTSSDGLTATALLPGGPQDVRAHPGLALARLEPALARAAVGGAPTAELHHLVAEGALPSVVTSSANLAEALESRVKGQAAAIRTVADRLAITRANLDLRPERPNGVFLFVGPTGVGKTELAREVALHEYGGYDRLIRLDMSEFAQEWAISRIAGPMPGYVGSDEPSDWLTTKVAAKPRSVILLDEIEKAHPRVWNIFLQVFDAGRLTDSRGVTADFKDAVVILTSNLGVIEAGSSGVGFGSTGVTTRRSDRVLEVVKERMAPELVNRMDELVVFDALSMEAITDIAAAELERATLRLSEAGWSLEVGPEVVEHLARTGYDPTYGARHLQRNIEREFIALLAKAPSRRLTVSLDGGVMTATPL